MDRRRVKVLGIPVDALDTQEASAVAAQALAGPDHLHIVTLNAEMALAANRDPALAQVIKKSQLVLPDGAGVVWAVKQRGLPVSKVAGVDFVLELASLCANTGRGIYLLGAASGVAVKAAERLAGRFEGLAIAGTRDGFFSPSEEAQVLETVRASQAAVLLVALGVPRQEFWIAEHQQQLGVPICMGVGGSLDVLAGKVQRAPNWMIVAHLEWLFRLVKEPWRWRRMAKALPAFALAALAARRRERYTGTGDLTAQVK